MKHHQYVVVLGATLALAIWAGAVNGGNQIYIEDFTTTQYKDALNTTAWWDTAAGELKLFPFVPTLAGSCDTPDYAFDVAVSGDYAYVANHFSLQVIDIGDPTAPWVAGSYDLLGGVSGVAISGDYAYMANGTFGLQVIDISDPAAPSLAGSYDTPDAAVVAAISGDYAYVADATSGLQVIDISDPTAPSYAGSYDTPDWAYALTISGDYAYVADGASGLQVIDISDPTAPSYAGSYDTPDWAYGATISGDYAYVADSESGLQVIDISDPTAPLSLGSYDSPGAARSVAISGEYAYLADFTSGLQVIDISDPTPPSLAGSNNTPSAARKVVISGDHAYVADVYSGLQMIDISNPTTPVVAGSYDTPGAAMGVAVSGDHAYVADYTSGLQVIDISDPTTPVIAGSYDTPGAALDVVVSGDHAYVADYGSGLQVIDISDPTAPVSAGSYATPMGAVGVAVSGDHAYVADLTSGLQVIDISDPTAPVSAGSCVTPGQAYGVAISGDYAYVADFSSGLQVIDVSDPTTPSLAGNCSLPDTAYSVAISGDYAYVADMDSGLQVIDISDPTTPSLARSYDTPDDALGVAISGDYAYVADDGSGLQVIQMFQRKFETSHNVGWSLAVNTASDTVFRARLATTQTAAVTWELSTDGGASWQGIVPGGSWSQLTVPGTDLVWRSTHTWARGPNPVVSQLEIDWLVEPALIDLIVDVPADQGGWVRVHFTRSSRDFADEVLLPISDYGIWRRVDSPALIAALNSVSSEPSEGSANGNTSDLSGIPIVTYQGSKYVQSRPGFAASSFPPGTWEFVMNVPAVQQDTYISAVPTVADSSTSGMNHTVFVITAHTTTPSIWYVCDPDSGYSVDNIAPAVPTGFAVAYNTGSGNQLSWDQCPDEDFQYFCVYRSSDPDFVPEPADLVHTTTTTSWIDPDYDGWNVYYKITALDFVGNESDPASAGTVTAVAEPVIPQTFALYQNVPNPFNPTTAIRYDVPVGGGEVTLRVYDVSGRLVRALVDGPEGPGAKMVTWDGRNDRGQAVSSGVYFYRMTAPGFDTTHKMVLLQ
jgi:hypothetical protein